jgi:hypothetical protein
MRVGWWRPRSGVNQSGPVRRHGMRGAIERRQIGNHRTAPRLQVGRARLAHRGASRGDGETSGVITLCRFPSRIASETGAPACREGERFGIGTVDNQRRDRIDPVGEEARVLLRFRLVGVTLGERIAGDGARAQNQRRRSLPAQRGENRPRIPIDHPKNDGGLPGIRSGNAGELDRLRRCLKSLVRGRYAAQFGNATKPLGERASITVFAEDQHRARGANRIAKIARQCFAHFECAEYRTKGRRARLATAAVRIGYDGCHAGLAKERPGGERRSRRAGADRDDGVAGDGLLRRFAGAVVDAVVIVDRKLDAGRFAVGIGLVGRQAHGIDHRHTGGLAWSSLRHDHRDFHGVLRERRQRRQQLCRQCCEQQTDRSRRRLSPLCVRRRDGTRKPTTDRHPPQSSRVYHAIRHVTLRWQRVAVCLVSSRNRFK